MIFGISGSINNIINNLMAKGMLWLSVIVCAVAFAFFESRNANNNE